MDEVFILEVRLVPGIEASTCAWMKNLMHHLLNMTVRWLILETIEEIER